MKTAEEIIDNMRDIWPYSLPKGTRPYIYEAMKIYANQKLDEAAEKARAQLAGKPLWSCDFWAEVDKQSILNLKDDI